MFKLSIALFCYILILQREAVSETGLKMSVDNIEIDTVESVVKLDFKHSMNSAGNVVLNIDLEVFNEIKAPMMVSFEIHHKQPTGEYNSIIHTEPRDFCALLNSPSLEPLLAVAFDGLQNHGDIASACPYKPGHYAVSNFELNPSKLHPDTIRGSFRADFIFTANEEGQQKQIGVAKFSVTLK